MLSQESIAPVSTHGLTSAMEVVAAATELRIIGVPIKSPPQRRVVLHCRMVSDCRRHFVRRERCSHRRRPSAVRVPIS